MLDRVATYQSDLPLFRALGLEPFNILVNGWHKVGTVKNRELSKGSRVEVWVMIVVQEEVKNG